MTEGPGHSRRVLGGSPVFRAASALDQQRDDVTYGDAVVVARLVFEHGGGPVPGRGKRAVIDIRGARRLVKLGFAQLDEGFGYEVGRQASSGWQLRATPEAEKLLRQLADEPPAP